MRLPLGACALLVIVLHLAWFTNAASHLFPQKRPRSRGIFEHLNTVDSGKSASDAFQSSVQEESQEGMPDKLDIVLTHYSKDTLNETVNWWSGFLRIDMVADLRPRVFVYCQNPNITDLSVLEPLLKYGGRLTHLDNLGRESHAFLTHITEHYDQLPQHILFSQDIPMDEKLWHRFQKMFEPTTGFLPLAVVGHQACDDGWMPNGLMAQVYSMFANKICPPEGFTAAYNGQFVVSRKRIRSIDWWTYHHLLDLVSAPAEHWIHDTHDDNIFKDPSNPFIGHVVERSWAVAFNCFDSWRSGNCYECDKRKGMNNCGKDACQCYDE